VLNAARHPSKAKHDDFQRQQHFEAPLLSAPEKGNFVVFAPEELKALEEGATHVVEIVSFVPEKSVDPLFYDKAFFIAPDKRGGKPYNLLRRGLYRARAQ
jgi:non-homologous end joining protein Ku